MPRAKRESTEKLLELTLRLIRRELKATLATGEVGSTAVAANLLKYSQALTAIEASRRASAKATASVLTGLSDEELTAKLAGDAP